MSYKRNTCSFIPLLMLLLLAGFCIQPSFILAAQKDSSQATEQPAATDQSSPAATALIERVKQYWGYKVAGDLDKAYNFEDPQTIQGTSVSDYMRTIGGAVKWLGAEVKSVTISGDTAKVTMQIKYIWTFAKDMGADGLTSEAREYWSLVDGVWYHRFVDPRSMRGPGGGGAAQQQPQSPTAPEAKE